MELIYGILALVAYIWFTAPRIRDTDELKSKSKDPFKNFTVEDFIQAAKEVDDQDTSKPIKPAKVSRPETTNYISILLSSTPIDDMTAYYMRQARDNDLYFIYINDSPNWRLKREERFNIDKGICQSCGKTIYLNSFHCHHKNYNSLFNEDMQDLVSLCWSCHQEEHNH